MKRTSMSKILFLFMIAASLPTFSTFSFADTANIYYDDVNRVVREEYGQNIPSTFTIAAMTDPNGHFPLLAVLFGALIGGAFSALNHTSILQGIVSGAISGAIFGEVGDIIANPENAVTEISQKVTLHAIGGAASGLANSYVTHGDAGYGFITGMMSGGFGSLAGGYLPDNFEAQFVGQTIAGGVAGGLTAEMSGFNFGKGFLSGAIKKCVNR